MILCSLLLLRHVALTLHATHRDALALVPMTLCSLVLLPLMLHCLLRLA